MKEQLITFETAKLAKEKGFNFSDLEYRDTKDNKVVVNWKERLDYFGTEKEAEVHKTPTQSLLQRWLREKHSLDILVVPNYCYAVLLDSNWKAILDGDSSIWNYVEELPFNSYEQALEQGLIKALKLI